MLEWLKNRFSGKSRPDQGMITRKCRYCGKTFTLPEMREDIHIPVRRPALAAVLSGMPGQAETEMKTVKPAGARTCQPVSTSMPRAASSAVTGASICRSVTTVFTRSFRLRGTVPCLENFSDSVRTMTRSA